MRAPSPLPTRDQLTASQPTAAGPRFFPLYYHSIEDEIPAPNQRMVRLGYVAWILAATGYLLNFLVLSVAFFGKGGKTNASTWFFALLTGAVGLPASWQFWYQALYRAAQTPAGLIAYGRFFVHMSFHLLFCIWMVLALPKACPGEAAMPVRCADAALPRRLATGPPVSSE